MFNKLCSRTKDTSSIGFVTLFEVKYVFRRKSERGSAASRLDFEMIRDRLNMVDKIAGER
jgi:hypothetical protein